MKLWKLISAFASAALVALVFSAIHANAAVDRVCNYTVGSTTTATGFANCTEEIGDLSTKAVAIVSSYTGTNDIVATSAPAVTSLVDGQLVQFTATATSSGSMTFKLDSTTARSIYKTDGTTALGAGDIVSGRRYLLSYKASTTRWLLMGIPTAAEVSNTPAGNISATTVQAAITELDNEKQPLDTDLTCFAGLTSAANKISYFTGVGTCATADFSAAIQTLITTPSSANMAALVTDETGTNKLVFSDNPVLVTPNLGTPSAVNLANGTALPVSGLSGLGSGVGTALGTGTNAAGGIPLQSGSPVALNCVRWKSGGGLEDAGATCGGGGGGGSPGGSSGDLQYNNAGAFGGLAKGPGIVSIGSTLMFVPRGHISGLTLSNNGTDAVNDIDIAAGQAASDDSTYMLNLASGITKQLDAAWAVGTNAGGLDTGTIGNNWYHVFLIARSDTGVVDVLYSLSASSPTMPTNYDKKRRIGSIRRAGATIVAFTQNVNEFLWNAAVVDVDAANPGTAAVTRTLTVPTGVKVLAKINAGTYIGTTNGVGATFSSLDVSDQAPQSGTTAALTGFNSMTAGTGSADWFLSEHTVRTNTSGQIRTRLSVSGAADRIGIITRGWIDYRGQE